MYTGTKVVVFKETIPPYNSHWVIKEYPSGKLFQVFLNKDDALQAVKGFELELIELREDK